jgi:hypothetical protein
MPDLKFSLDLGSVVSPVLLLVLAYLVNAARKAVDKRVDERHEETQGRLDAVVVQTTTTNGTVRDHSAAILDLQSRMLVEETTSKLLTSVYLKTLPDKGE